MNPFMEVFVYAYNLLEAVKIQEELCIYVLVSAAAGNKSATQPTLPPPACGGEWKERGRNWWVGIRAV